LEKEHKMTAVPDEAPDMDVATFESVNRSPEHENSLKVSQEKPSRISPCISSWHSVIISFVGAEVSSNSSAEGGKAINSERKACG